MPRLRHGLSWLAAFWLFCQIAGFAAAPIVFANAASHVESEEECECPGTAPGQACPMHKGHEKTPDDENTCRMRNACSPLDAALLTLCGSIGVLSGPSGLDLYRAPAAVALLTTNTILRAHRPDAPPPRS